MWLPLVSPPYVLGFMKHTFLVSAPTAVSKSPRAFPGLSEMEGTWQVKQHAIEIRAHTRLLEKGYPPGVVVGWDGDITVQQ